MRVVGCIAEFNPFHNGHAFFLEQAKRQTQSDFCVVVMSGNFVQRGARQSQIDMCARQGRSFARGGSRH